MAYKIRLEEDEILVYPLDQQLIDLLSSIPGTGFDSLLNCARVPARVRTLEEIKIAIGTDKITDLTNEDSSLQEENVSISEIPSVRDVDTADASINLGRELLSSQHGRLASYIKCTDSFKQTYEIIDAGIREYAIRQNIIDPVENVAVSQIISSLVDQKRVSLSLKNTYFSIKNIRNIIGHPRQPFASYMDEFVVAGTILISILERCLIAVNSEIYSVILEEFQREQQSR